MNLRLLAVANTKWDEEPNNLGGVKKENNGKL